MSSLVDQTKAVRTREDFITFVHALRDDYLKNPRKWENSTLDTFLEAVSGWVADMDGFFDNIGEPVPEQPDWNLVATILYMGSRYE